MSATATSSHALRDFDQSLPMALLRAREAVMRHFRPLLADHGLTEQQWRVLRALADSDEPLSVGELAKETFLLGPSLSRMLVTLEQRSLVSRELADDDGRRAELTISAEGRDLVAEIAPRSEATYGIIEEHLGDGVMRDLQQLLGRVAQL